MILENYSKSDLKIMTDFAFTILIKEIDPENNLIGKDDRDVRDASVNNMSYKKWLIGQLASTYIPNMFDRQNLRGEELNESEEQYRVHFVDEIFKVMDDILEKFSSSNKIDDDEDLKYKCMINAVCSKCGQGSFSYRLTKDEKGCEIYCEGCSIICVFDPIYDRDKPETWLENRNK